MSEFGTGLRAHLNARTVAVDAPAPEVVERRRDVEEERERLQRLAAELAGKELELAQREADLHAEQERMALSLAHALLQKAKELSVPPPLDELAVARARRLRW